MVVPGLPTVRNVCLPQHWPKTHFPTKAQQCSNSGPTVSCSQSCSDKLQIREVSVLTIPLPFTNSFHKMQTISATWINKHLKMCIRNKRLIYAYRSLGCCQNTVALFLLHQKTGVLKNVFDRKISFIFFIKKNISTKILEKLQKKS